MKPSNDVRVNIGCGRDYREGWFNVDISREVRADFYADIGKDTLPINEANHVYISGVLEQIKENKDFVHALNECWRILRYGGTMLAHVPNVSHKNAFKDPFDVRYFSEETWNYVLGDKREYALYGSVYGFHPWDLLDITTNANGIICINLKK